MADLVLKEEGFGDLLPGADAIVIDEAHQLPESRRELSRLRRFEPSAAIAGARSSPRSCSRAGAQRRCPRRSRRRSIGSCRSAGCAARAARALRVQGVAGARSIESLEQPAGAARRIRRSRSAKRPRTAPGSRALRRRGAELAERLRVADRQEEAAAVPSVRWAQATGQGVSLHYVPLDVAEQLGALVEAHTQRLDLHVGDARGRRQLRSLHAAHRHARARRPRASAARSTTSARRCCICREGCDPPSSPRHTEQVIDAALPVLRRQRRTRVPVVHESSRAARRGRDPVARGSGRRCRFRCWCRAMRRAKSLLIEVSRVRQRGAARDQQLLGRRRREGRGAVGRRSSTSCRSPRPTIRCSRRGSTRSSGAAAIRSSKSRFRRR